MNKFDKVTEVIECESIVTQLHSNSLFAFKKKGHIRLIRDYIRRSYVLEFFYFYKEGKAPSFGLNISRKELSEDRIHYRKNCRTTTLQLSEGVVYLEITNDEIAKNLNEKLRKCLEDTSLIDDSLIIFDKSEQVQSVAKKPKINNFEIRNETVKLTKDDILLDMYRPDPLPKQQETIKIEEKQEVVVPVEVKEEVVAESSVVSKKFYSNNSEKPRELSLSVLNDLGILEDGQSKKISLTPKASFKRRRDDFLDDKEKDKPVSSTKNVKFVRNTPSVNTRVSKKLNMTPKQENQKENNFNFDDDLLKSPVKTWNRNNSKTFLKGFSNLGNTCYMNSILQCILNIDIFALELLQNYDKIKQIQLDKFNENTNDEDLNEEQILLLETDQNYLYNCLCELVKARESHNEDLKVKSLRDIKSTISKEATRFSGYQQHDAHEFLCQILDQLKDEACKLEKSYVDNKKSKNGSELSNPVVNNFEFQVTHAIECKTCGNTIVNYEEYNNLCLELPENFLDSSDDQKELSIQNALDIFFKDELLTDFKCEKCNTRGENLIKRKFVRLPRVLILHLKRYQFKEVVEEIPKTEFNTINDDLGLFDDDHKPNESPTKNEKIVSFKLVKNESSVLIPCHLNLNHLLTTNTKELKLPLPVKKEILEMSLKIDHTPQPITPMKSSQGMETRSKLNNTPTLNRPVLGKIPSNSPQIKSLKFENNNFLTPNNKPRRPLSTLRAANSVGKNTKFLDGVFDYEPGDQIIQKKLVNPRVDLSQKFNDDLKKAKKISLAMYKAETQFDIDDKDESIPDMIEDPFSDDEMTKKPKKEIKKARVIKDESKSGDNSYRIIGIVNHLGSSSNSGHYISDVFNLRTKRWSSFDDNHVESLSEEVVFSNRVKTGYIFFYIHNSLVKD
ncbi:unnamed protein product [Brachionus calyciflorus]|uniref:USP domain-containing protein n=1 Tax=Brachionus calyciflorus TaxID=104777 RepID=A0A814A827_9BILA|nr:unnamed protein product [Brachionus calyciflorus]